MKHASLSAPPLQVRIRHLGFNPDQLTAAEQEELVAIDEILDTPQDDETNRRAPTHGQPQQLLVSP